MPEQDTSQPQSVEEYAARLNALNLPGASSGSAGNGGTDPGEHPVRKFFKKVWDAVSYTPDANEMIRGIRRGVATGANELINSVGQAMEGGARSQVRSNAIRAGQPDPGITPIADHHVISDEDISLAYGPASTDKFAQFAEGVSQFAVGFAATSAVAPEVEGAGLAAKAGKVAVPAIRGALADAAAFDPNTASLAQMLARVPIPGLRDLGQALSQNPNDTELVKRMKRAAAGALPGVALDGLIALARYVGANNILRSSVTGAPRTAAEQLVHDNAEILAKIARGEHAPEGAHVKVVSVPDANPHAAFAFGQPIVRFKLEPTAPLSTHISLEPVAMEADAPHFNSYGEAQAQAETINAAMDERLSAARMAGGLTHEQAGSLRDAYNAMLDAKSPDALRAVTEGTHFNFSYISEPKEVLSQIEAVSQVFKKELDAAQITDGITVEQHAARVRQFLDGMEPEQAPALMTAALGRGDIPLSIRLNAADVVLRDIAGKASRLFDVIEARPHDAIAWEEARLAAGQMLKLQEALAGANSETGRALKFLQDRDAVAAAARGEKAPAPHAGTPDVPAQGAPADAAAATPRLNNTEVHAVLKMVKMTGGAPSKLPGIAQAAQIVHETGWGRRALEFFVNSALSNPKTHMTALTMNTMVSTYEAATRMFAGAVTANPALLREGADLLFANERYTADNIQTALMAFRRGQSVIHPAETHLAIPGAVGEAIRTPSRGLLFIDEFTRVTNYRSYLYAKSMRYWREKGLDGPSLAAAVDNDVRTAFDPRTGEALNSEALKFAEVPTMSAALGRETPGGRLTNYLNNSVESKFVAPFVKTSVNIFRYTFDRMPLLNMLAKRNRDIIAAGGEAAAVLHTQTAMATMLGFWAYMKTKSGEVTGSGPKSPTVRAGWLDDHKPYSIKIDGKWQSYRSLDPIFTPVSIMADVHDMVQELAGHDDATAEDIIAGSLAGIAASFANKTYMQGTAQFMDAWTGGKGDLMKKWMEGMVTTFTDPQILRAVNNDPYLREVHGMLDAVKAGIPGLSESLPAMYNAFGEPVLRTNSFMPAPIKGDATPTVATDLFNLGKGMPPLPRKSLNGVQVDLTNGSKFGKVDGLSPYEFMQRAIREPGEGEPSLRDALTEVVHSQEWKDASPGSDAFPGGERFVMAYRVVDEYRRRAVGKMLDAFPSVQDEIQLNQARKAQSFSDGNQGDLDALREFGKGPASAPQR